VLVTGASGFLGRHVVTAFLEKGHSVRAVLRPTTNASRFEWHDRVEVFRADLRAARDLNEAFDGIDILVHLAACVVGDDDERFASTVIGTENLLKAMAHSKTNRVLLASSFSVYDWQMAKGRLTEQTPLESKNLYTRDSYAVAKIWQERVTERFAQEYGWDLTILRPGFIWGRGNEQLAGMGVRIGSMYLIFGTCSRMPLTHVENAAQCFVAASQSPKMSGQTCNLVDSPGVRTWRYVGDYLRNTRSGGFRMIMPYWLGMGLVRIVDLTSKMIFNGKGKLPSLFVPCRFEARFKPLKYSNQKLQTLLNWQPHLDYQQCVKRTYEQPNNPCEKSNL